MQEKNVAGLHRPLRLRTAPNDHGRSSDDTDDRVALRDVAQFVAERVPQEADAALLDALVEAFGAVDEVPLPWVACTGTPLAAGRLYLGYI